jgi:hypothetical protein
MRDRRRYRIIVPGTIIHLWVADGDAEYENSD